VSFRFLHAADTHIDSPMRGLGKYDDAPEAVLRDAQRRAFENLVALAIRENVAFVLLAGDIYDGDWPDFSTGNFFARQMARLGEAGIPVYLISGNHDAASKITRALTLPSNVKVFAADRPESVEVEGLPVTIHGQSFATSTVTENLAAGYPGPAAGRFNIGLLHTALEGQSGPHARYAPSTVGELRDKGYDYWALGHVHKPAVLEREPWVVYPGNIQGRDAGELGPRGCMLVEVDDQNRATAEFHALDVARWEHLEVDLAGCEDLTACVGAVADALRAALDDAEGRLLSVRVTAIGATPVHGQLLRETERWRAEVIAQAQMLDAERIWIEKTRIRTTPVYDLAELAARDDLLRIVIESIDEADLEALANAPEIDAMLRRLPEPEVGPEVRGDLEGDARAVLLADVRAILLEALSTGGEAPA
jgi:DNA repair exonuclease SbcCD nuclease subunit